MNLRLALVGTLALGVWLAGSAGCGASDEKSESQGGSGGGAAGEGGGSGAAGKAGADASVDAPPDTSADAPDTSLDVAPDMSADVTPDASADVAPDTSLDAPPDMEPDQAVDSPPDVEPDLPEECGAPLVSCNGSCIDVSSDPDNCGECGHPCTANTGAKAVCDAGICSFTCEPGWGDCNSEPGDQCETSVLNDPDHCGSCDPCALPNAVAACNQGECAVDSCVAPWIDCNSSAGCETNSTVDPLHCGSCGFSCSNAHTSTMVCNAGTGGTATCPSLCQPGYLNCNTGTVPDDGCETPESAQQCGSCTNSCPTGFNCTNALCACTTNPSCGPGSCDTATLGGRCTCLSISGTLQVCNRGEVCLSEEEGGGAGGGNYDIKCACNGGASCTAGQTCCKDGCHNLAAESNNCGACGAVCPTGFACNAGSDPTVGVCHCQADEQCNAGNSGTCVQPGVCLCSGASSACAAGKRCLSDGTCG